MRLRQFSLNSIRRKEMNIRAKWAQFIIKSENKGKKTQKRLDFFEQILYDNQADLRIQPAQSKYDPLAQSVEHLTFNQGVRSSNLRWITKEKPWSRCVSTVSRLFSFLFQCSRFSLASIVNLQALCCIFKLLDTWIGIAYTAYIAIGAKQPLGQL